MTIQRNRNRFATMLFSASLIAQLAVNEKIYARPTGQNAPQAGASILFKRSPEEVQTSPKKSGLFLAEKQSGERGADSATRPTNASPSEEPEENYQETETIVVTGSHIRGHVPAGVTVDIYTAEDLDRSGYATVHDFIATLPENFQGGGGNEDRSTGSLAASNQLGGSSVNLRGAGADSTLILLNGRRVPASGLDANFTDISTIPQTVIERVEILPDGASALYGSDAVGGVVNFILKKDFEGAETRFRYGLAPEGNVNEYRIAQTFGQSWNTGHFILNYEYYQRDHLRYKERSFTKSLDLRPYGGPDNRQFYSNPGNILDPSTFLPAFAIPQHQNGRSLDVSELNPGQINLMDRSDEDTILPKQERNSIFFSGEQKITDTVSVFAELRYSNRKAFHNDFSETTALFVPESNPFFIDPFGQGLTIVAYSFEPELGPIRFKSSVSTGAATAGTNIEIGTWQWQTYASAGQEKSRNRYKTINFERLDAALADPDPETAFNPFGDGRVNNPVTLNNLRQEITRRPKTRLVNAKTVFDGPLLSIKETEISLAVGGEYRWDQFKYNEVLFGEELSDSKLSRNIYSLFAEMFVPLVEDHSNLKLIDSLNLSISARYDKYSDFGSTTNPKIGITWKPASTLSLKASYGTSYRAPNLIEKTTTNNRIMIIRLNDPSSANGRTSAIVLTGNDPETKSENSESWTLGLNYRPEFIEGLSFDINYFNISYDDRITTPIGLSRALENDSLFKELIIRNPTQEQISLLCSSPDFESSTTQCLENFIGAIVDFRTQNFSKTKINGLDFLITYDSIIGSWQSTVGVQGTYLIDHKEKLGKNSPEIERVDTINHPIDFRLKAYLSVNNDGIGAFAAGYYSDGYKNNISQFQRTISSHVSFDASLFVLFSSKMKISRDAPFRLSLSVTNIFNNKPPYAENGFVAYDSDNFDPLGRVIAAELRVLW